MMFVMETSLSLVFAIMAAENRQPVVLITGCSSGLGEALARQMNLINSQTSKQTFDVVASARRLDSIKHLADMGMLCVSLDVTDVLSIKKAMGEIMEKKGRIDVLICNAGLSAVGPIAEQPIEELRRVMDTNLFGVIQTVQAVVPIMAAQGGGVIVNVGSVVSQMTTPWSGMYSASKAALLAVTDAMRLELRPFRIGVSYVVAGSIKSSIAENTLALAQYSRYKSSTQSLYSHWSRSIETRASMSQGEGSMPADDAAKDIMRVIERALLINKNALSIQRWFFTGGHAVLYWGLGLLQKIFGWPTDAIFAKRFGLMLK